MKRIMILAVAAIMLAVAAAPAMAQTDDKAAKRAAKQEQRAQERAAKQGQRAQNTAPANGGGAQKAAPVQEAVPNDAFAQKALPSSGGTPIGNVALLGAGGLLVGGGLLVRRIVR